MSHSRSYHVIILSISGGDSHHSCCWHVRTSSSTSWRRNGGTDDELFLRCELIFFVIKSWRFVFACNWLILKKTSSRVIGAKSDRGLKHSIIWLGRELVFARYSKETGVFWKIYSCRAIETDSFSDWNSKYSGRLILIFNTLFLPCPISSEIERAGAESFPGYPNATPETAIPGPTPVTCSYEPNSVKKWPYSAVSGTFFTVGAWLAYVAVVSLHNTAPAFANDLKKEIRPILLCSETCNWAK